MKALLFPFAYEMETFLGETEYRSLEEQGKGGFRFHTSKAHPEWLLAVTGQGKVEAAIAAQHFFDCNPCDEMYLLGSAAALEPDLAVGDVLVADACLEYDFGTGGKHPRFPYPDFSIPPSAPGTGKGLLLSGDADALDPEQKARLHEKHRGRALAWEGAGFARFLRRNGAKGWEIRVITETAAEEFPGLAGFRLRLRECMPRLRMLVESIRLRP